jgi:DNA-binding NarL/FixJ family response regulator
MSDSSISIVLADDHVVVSEGLRMLLDGEPGFSVVGVAKDGLEALRLVEKLLPRILLVDLAMPNLNGLEVARQVIKRHPQVRVIVLSMHANEAYVLEAFRNGVSGYVLKDASFDEVIKSIREVAAGRRFLSAAFSRERIDSYLQKADSAALDPYESLTSREREILQMTAESQSSASIGRRLYISPRTVEIHRQNAMRKLGLKSQSELIRYALKKGILSNP